MTKSITLVVDFEKNETKTFYQPEHIKGSAALEGMVIGKAMEKKGEDISPEDFERVADFIVKYLYPGEFTSEELIDGLNAKNGEIFEQLTEQLSSIFGDETENFTEEKEA